MELLTRFAAVSLASGVILTLLPEGTIRRTARLVIGLMLLMLWAEGLQSLLTLPSSASVPTSVLSPSSTSLEQQAAQAAAQLAAHTEGSP